MFEDFLENADKVVKPDNQNFTNYQSVEDMLQYMSSDREVVDTSKSEIPDDDFIEDVSESLEFEDDKKSEVEVVAQKEIVVDRSVRLKMARSEARFLAKTNDSLHSFFCGLIADDESDKFSAENEDLKEIENLIFDMRKDSDKHLPPWIQVLGYISVVYGPMYKDAIGLRKIKKINAKLEAENKKQIAIINQQNAHIVEYILEQKKKAEAEAKAVDTEKELETKEKK